MATSTCAVRRAGEVPSKTIPLIEDLYTNIYIGVFPSVQLFRNRSTVLDSNNLRDQALNRALTLQTFLHVPSVKAVTNLVGNQGDYSL